MIQPHNPNKFLHALIKITLNGIKPYPGFGYTLPVPMVKWVHNLYLKPVCILNSPVAI
jgi:hypothetical protein